MAETYLQAKPVPLAEWPAAILTFLAEGPLVKANTAGLQETANSYDEFRKNLISILGRTEDKEQARLDLDSPRQQPIEAVADFASRILECLEGFGRDGPRGANKRSYTSLLQWPV